MNDKKKCSKCGVEKPLTEFSKDKSRKSGFQYRCKECKQLENKNVYIKNHPNMKEKHKCKDGYKYCPQCKIEKLISDFYKYKNVCWCISCTNKKHREYSNKAEVKERLKEYNQKPEIKDRNKKRIKEYNKEYRKNSINIERERNLRRVYSKTDEGKRNINRYRNSPKGRIVVARLKHIRRAREKNTKCTLTLKQKNVILQRQNNRCDECHKEFTSMLKPTEDHIIPVSLFGDYTSANIRFLCQSCNSSKLNHTYFMKAIDNLLSD